MTEEDFVAANGSRERSGKASPLARKWADNMTAHYDELAGKNVVFGQLRNCIDLAVVSALIVEGPADRESPLQHVGLFARRSTGDRKIQLAEANRHPGQRAAKGGELVDQCFGRSADVLLAIGRKGRAQPRRGSGAPKGGSAGRRALVVELKGHGSRRSGSAGGRENVMTTASQTPEKPAEWDALVALAEREHRAGRLVRGGRGLSPDSCTAARRRRGPQQPGQRAKGPGPARLRRRPNMSGRRSQAGLFQDAWQSGQHPAGSRASSTQAAARSRATARAGAASCRTPTTTWATSCESRASSTRP